MNTNIVQEKDINITSATDEYYVLLEKFVELCEQFMDKGQPYLTVILCHELYRFLYPVEPYADFAHDNPVEFITNHVKSLIEAATHFSEVVTPYANEFGDFHEDESEAKTLEKSTSDMYSDLWEDFDIHALTEESIALLRMRIPHDIIENYIVGKKVLDMGCGSGRYSIGLARVGARQVVGVDLQSKSFSVARRWCTSHNFAVEFQEGNVHHLPFDNNTFDFIFCNGVLHHTSSIEKGLQELSRVLKRGGRAFLYIYAAGGIFWITRQALRRVFKKLPISYTKLTLSLISMPSNRFIFCDTWYVPVETHTTAKQLHGMLKKTGFSYRKILGNSSFDLDRAIAENIEGAEEMWGDGEHRYILEKN